MSGFSFPPPPPPPPPSASASTLISDSSQGLHNRRGTFNQRWTRGRGRGSGRGHFQRTDPDQHGAYPSRVRDSNSASNQRFSAHNVPATAPSQSALLEGPILKRSHNQAFNDQSQHASASKQGSKPKVPPPPSVPSFGFMISPISAPNDSKPDDQSQSKPKIRAQKNNLLGLTPNGDTRGEDGQDIDEEAAYAQSGQCAIIQHRGQSIQLNTAADVAAWIAERKKRFPTAARIATRKAAQDEARLRQQEAREAEKQRRLEARSKTIQAKLAKKRPKTEPGSTIEKTEVSAQTEVIAPNLDDPMARIAALEEQLRQAKEELANHSSSKGPKNINSGPQHEDNQQCSVGKDTSNEMKTEYKSIQSVEIDSSTRAQETQLQGLDLGLTYYSDVDEDVDKSSEVSSEDPSSDSSEGDSDSDEPPEETSAKRIGDLDSQSITQEGPNNSQMCYAFANTGRCKYGDRCMRSHDVPCRFFKKNGHCRYGDKCRMSHDVTPGTGKKKSSEKAVPSRTMSLRERMVEKELLEEAAAGLVVIKQLGASGFFNST